ncbi:MAG TPA: glycoside hydrolase family 9 protein [Gemmatimonadaceae bacterium]|nr:glycoside hydrolase family 9 protein [Gemmatimonadaceae bacterium]
MRRHLWILALLGGALPAQQPAFTLTDREYFRRGGVDVMAFQDFYPDGHQGGVTVVQHGVRLAANGDLRLEATPGQWSPIPQRDRREVRRGANAIVTWLSFPDTSKDRHGFNPIVYPDLKFGYQVTVTGEGDAVRVRVDLDRALPAEWVGRVGFNLELYPGDYFGRSWQLGGRTGVFPRQANGPVVRDAGSEVQAVPFARGRTLTLAAEVDSMRMVIESAAGDLELLDGRVKHNNGWFIVRSPARAGATRGAVEWVIRPHAIPGWRAAPVVQVSQLGYHPRQRKVAVIELDAADQGAGQARLLRASEVGAFEPVLAATPARWTGSFLRYGYRHFDFSTVTRPGVYVVEYRGRRTHPFRIADDVYRRDAWQPTLEYFLPVQMCHVRVEENYRVWHGLDHMDDAIMAPVDTNHFDGYVQGPSTLTRFKPGDRVPGMAVGGWHDAGDDDFRIESQADEIHVLASIHELFGLAHDNTTIDQARRLVRIREPDGKPDLLQQVEHGVINVLAGYRALGRLYRGVIVPTLSQYVLVGDPAHYSDNLAYDPTLAPGERTATASSVPDDRLVFTERHPGREYKGIAALAIAGRVLREYDPALARESVEAAEALWRQEREPKQALDDRVAAATELFLTTRKPEYRQALLDLQAHVVARIAQAGWAVGRALPLLDAPEYARAVREAVAKHAAEVRTAQARNPYGVPYEPVIWGAGWGIQRFGVEQYYLHRAFPDLVSPDYALNALEFVLGRHPGRNTASYASGVGARSMTTAYGFNRGDWSYIPGGVVSGTALIRPDLPELKDFPFLWQQAEYVLGGGATHYMFLVLAADRLLTEGR